MKLEMTLIGKAELTRTEVIEILKEHLKKESPDFKATSFVFEPSFERVIIKFQSNRNDGIDDPYHKNDNKKTSKDIKKGFSRPNYGVGEAIKASLDSSKEKSILFDEMFNDLKHMFPKLTSKDLQEFVTRSDYKKRLKYTFDKKTGVLTKT